MSQIIGVHLFNTCSQNKLKFPNVVFKILYFKQIKILDFDHSGSVLSGRRHVFNDNNGLFMVKSADYFDASLRL